MEEELRLKKNNMKLLIILLALGLADRYIREFSMLFCKVKGAQTITDQDMNTCDKV